ncbi:Cystathionine beta-lyase PatB [compost metagenome]
MTIDFDKVVSRYGTNCAKWDGMAQVLGREMIALSVADMDLQAPPQVIERVTEMAKHGIYGYTDPFPPYYEAVQGWIKKAYDWEVPQEWIVFCPRIVQAVSLIIQNFTQPGDQVLIHTPAYQPVAKSVELNNRVLVESPLCEVNGHYEIDFADMELRMQAGVKIVLLISPHNPVGRVWTRAELERIVSLCTKYDAYIVSDDIHADFIHEGHEHTIIGKISTEAEQRSFICTSPGKTFNLASLEIANIVIPNDQLREKFRHCLQQAGCHNPTFFAVPALEVAYTECDEWLEELRGYITANIVWVKAYIAEYMPELRVIESEGTYLLWVDCRAISTNEAELKQWIESDAKVSVSFGTGFGASGEGFIRLNIATPLPMLQEAFHRLYRAYPLKNS